MVSRSGNNHDAPTTLPLFMPTVLNILDKKGKVLASSKPVGSCGASFTEFTLKVPEIAGDCFVLQLHNKSGGNLFVNKLELH